jgi:uncharacterized protein
MREHVRDGLLRVVVKPNSHKTEVLGWDPVRNALVVRLRSRPQDGKANAELVKLVSKELGARAAIKSGSSSREKVLRIS